MNGNIHILTFGIGNRLYGIDLEEIVRVIPIETSTGKLPENEQETVSICNFIRIPDDIEYSSLIIIKNEAMNNPVIKIPTIIDIIGCSISKIMVVPELVRTKQNPFFVWGFLADKGKMITLISFTFLKK